MREPALTYAPNIKAVLADNGDLAVHCDGRIGVGARGCTMEALAEAHATWARRTAQATELNAIADWPDAQNSDPAVAD